MKMITFFILTTILMLEKYKEHKNKSYKTTYQA